MQPFTTIRHNPLSHGQADPRKPDTAIRLPCSLSCGYRAESALSDYNFEPDYQKWWNRPDLTESHLVWLMLAINPDAAQKSLDLTSKTNLADEEIRWKQGFSNYLHGLSYGLWAAGKHRGLMEAKLWGHGKDDFIVNAYNWRVQFPEPFAAFLKSMEAMPNHFDHYKNHEQYRDSLSAWKLSDIDSEDKALSLLLGFAQEFFQRFFFLTETLKDDGAWEKASHDDRYFFLEYQRFNISEYSLDPMLYGAMPGFYKKVKVLDLWRGDFAVYAQEVHDAGFVFKRKTYEALELHRIRPVYTRDGWARSFYRAWIERGVWRLKDAALLYLGDDPFGGRGFHGFGESGRKGPGRILLPDQTERNGTTFFLVDETGEWVEPPLDNREEETSIECFVKDHIQAGNLTLASADDGLKFKPIEIVSFFRKYFSLTYEPQALLLELDMGETHAVEKVQPEISQPSKTHTGFAGRPPKSRDFMEQEFDRRKQQGIVAESLANEVRALIAWLKQNHSEMPVPTEKTVKNNLGGMYRQYKNEKQSA